MRHCRLLRNSLLGYASIACIANSQSARNCSSYPFDNNRFPLKLKLNLHNSNSYLHLIGVGLQGDRMMGIVPFSLWCSSIHVDSNTLKLLRTKSIENDLIPILSTTSNIQNSETPKEVLLTIKFVRTLSRKQVLDSFRSGMITNENTRAGTVAITNIFIQEIMKLISSDGVHKDDCISFYWNNNNSNNNRAMVIPANSNSATTSSQIVIQRKNINAIKTITIEGSEYIQKQLLYFLLYNTTTTTTNIGTELLKCIVHNINEIVI